MDERVYTINLRDVYAGTRTVRAKRAIMKVKEFLKENMKANEVKIGDSINKKVWEHGIQSPPHSIRIHAIKEGDIVYSELLGVEIKLPSKEAEKKKEEKKKEKKEKIEKEREEKKEKTLEEQLKSEQGQKS